MCYSLLTAIAVLASPTLRAVTRVAPGEVKASRSILTGIVQTFIVITAHHFKSHWYPVKGCSGVNSDWNGLNNSWQSILDFSVPISVSRELNGFIITVTKFNIFGMFCTVPYFIRSHPLIIVACAPLCYHRVDVVSSIHRHTDPVRDGTAVTVRPGDYNYEHKPHFLASK